MCIRDRLVEDKLVPLIRSILKERQAGQRRMPIFARAVLTKYHHAHIGGGYQPYAVHDFLKGFPTSEGKPVPCKGKCFSWLLKTF